jgi:hypothetical protein
VSTLLAARQSLETHGGGAGSVGGEGTTRDDGGDEFEAISKSAMAASDDHTVMPLAKALLSAHVCPE